MKTFVFLLMLFCILFSFPIIPQYYDSECPLIPVDPRAAYSQTGGKYKPASNLPGQYFRILVVFVQFQDDNMQLSEWPLGQLPNYSDDFIDFQTASEYRDMTVSDYWKEMAMGNYDVIGDVYPELVILRPESYYQWHPDTLCYRDCNRNVIDSIDANVDFNLYDNWRLQSGQFIFSPGLSDGYVDMVFVIYRHVVNNVGISGYRWFTYPWGSNWSGIAHLGMSYTTNDHNALGQPIKLSGSSADPGSGLTIKKGWGSHYDLMGLCNHEFGHFLFGSDHTRWGGIMGGGTYALSGWERERLGYLGYVTVTQDNFSVTLTDMITTGYVLRIPIPISNPNSINYFLVENHQRVSHYDQITMGGSLYGQWNFNTDIGTGIYITLNYYADDFQDLEIYPKFADGQWSWAVVDTFENSILCGCPLPLFKRTGINRNTGTSDRLILTSWFGNYERMWYDIDPWTGDWWQSDNCLGDDTDPFTLNYNNIFSPWSNPSSYSNLTSLHTNYSVWLYNQNGDNISVQVKTTENSSLSLPPSKPHLGWDPTDYGMPYKYGWVYLAWGADIWDELPIESDINWSELQRKIGTNPWTTIYSGPNRIWTDGSVIYDPNGSMPVYFRVRVRDTQGLWSVWSDIYSTAMMPGHPGIEKYNSNELLKESPLAYSLEQNYPNPFNPFTYISYSIPKNGFVTLKVFDILGNEVAELVSEIKEAGSYSVTFNASEFSSGIYFYTLTSGTFVATKKLILLK